MKKLLLLLFIAPLFIACGSDDDDDKIEYLDNKLIEGSWYRINNSDSIVYTFKDNRAEYVIIDKYTLEENQKWEYFGYKLSADKIYFSWKNNETVEYRYKLSSDMLEVAQGGPDKPYSKYYRAK